MAKKHYISIQFEFFGPCPDFLLMTTELCCKLNWYANIFKCLFTELLQVKHMSLSVFLMYIKMTTFSQLYFSHTLLLISMNAPHPHPHYKHCAMCCIIKMLRTTNYKECIFLMLQSFVFIVVKPDFPFIWRLCN